MRRPQRLGLWWAPLLLVLAPAMGYVPAHRDLVDFFAPMRRATAEMIGVGTAPWLNLGNGCGEAWFANPETAVLYPPAWMHLVLPGQWAMTLEIGLHLALLSLGVGLLARDLGASSVGRLLTEVAAWSAGPVLVTVGVLNNLETLTWLPWMVLAARLSDRRSVPLLAAATAMAWLGGEPQVWAVGVALVIGVARARGAAMVGLAIGVASVAVQLIPFLVWVAEGDRGPSAAAWALRGALAPADWGGVLAPHAGSAGGRMVYAESLFFGAPVLVCALLGGWRRKWVLAVVVVLGILATLPEIGGGDLFLAITGGLVRYPSRFALIGLVMLLPCVGKGADEWLAGKGKWLAVVVSGVTLAACAMGVHPLRWWVAGAPAALLLVAAFIPSRRGLRGAVLVAGVAGMVVAGLPLLELRTARDLWVSAPTWPEATDGARVYTPAPDKDVMRWLAMGLGPRRLWPVGYLNLEEGLTLTRTDAPVANGRLAAHLAIADEGPSRRWWLDVLGARWVILPAAEGLPETMEEVRQKGGMRLLRNLGALPVVSLADRPPDPNIKWRRAGEVKTLKLEANRCDVTTIAPRAGWLWVSLAPVQGWQWRLDGVEVKLEQGPGIVQYLEVPAGRHRLEGRYRPPGLLPAALVSTAAVLMALFVIGYGRYGHSSINPVSEPAGSHGWSARSLRRKRAMVDMYPSSS